MTNLTQKDVADLISGEEALASLFSKKTLLLIALYTFIFVGLGILIHVAPTGEQTTQFIGSTIPV